jgi:tetratricopeptide (TPR) repeat protein
MDATPGADYPFCRACTANTVDVPPRPARRFLLVGVRHIRWGRRCGACGSVPRIRFLCLVWFPFPLWIPLIPVGDKSRAVRLGNKVHAARRMREHSAAEDNRAVVVRYLEAVKDHPDLLNQRQKQADVLWAQGDVTGALTLYEPVLAEHEKVLGADHPGSLILCHQVARAYLDLRRPADAIPLLERVFRHRLRVLGSGHPDTAAAFEDFVNTVDRARTMMPLKPMFERSLAALAEPLGADHPRTIRARIWLGRACVDLGHDDEAIRHLERALDDSIRVLGADHPDVALVRDDLISACQAAHDSPNVPHIEEALRVRRKLLGVEHPDTVTSKQRLALAYQEISR